MKQQTENQIQADFFTWLALHEKKYPELSLCYAIPNGSYKSPAARGLHKRTGLKAGVPDIHLPLPSNRGDLHPIGFVIGLWIEFKAKAGRVSDSQIEWQTKLRLIGHRVEICRSWTEAANIVIDYLNLPLTKFPDARNADQVGK
jgi:hypothetical protein